MVERQVEFFFLPLLGEDGEDNRKAANDLN